MKRQDEQLKQSVTLPNGAATTNSSGIDLGTSSRSDFLAECEAVITAPALATGLLPDGQTVTYSLRHSDDPTFASDEELYPSLLTQTGAAGAGAAAAEKRVRLPVDVKRYLRVRAVKTGAADASGAAGELSLQF